MKKLPGLGPTLSKLLNKVGIDSIEKLREVGVKNAFLMIDEIMEKPACINKLCSLEATVSGRKWNKLDLKVKEELKEWIHGRIRDT